jgi:hypothetical protein
LPREFNAAAGWLKVNTGTGTLILAKSGYSAFIPALSGRRVYVGHTVETVGYERKAALARRVFANAYAPAELETLARQEGWTHVWVSAAERRDGFDLVRYPGLTTVYENSEVRIAAFRP